MMTKTFLPMMAAAFLVLGLAACAEFGASVTEFPMGAGSPDYATEGPGVPSDICTRDRSAC